MQDSVEISMNNYIYTKHPTVYLIATRTYAYLNMRAMYKSLIGNILTTPRMKQAISTNHKYHIF